LILRLLLLSFLLVSSFSCAPKKVKVYEGMAGIRVEIVNFALSLSGSPYRAGSKGPGAFDCSGFVHYVYRRFGILLPKQTEDLLRTGEKVARQDVLPADLVFFRVEGSMHVGIMLNREEFVHVSKSDGVKVSCLREPYWARHLLLFRRVL